MSETPSTLSEPALLPLGADGVLIRFSDRLDDAANARAIAFRDRVAAAALDGVTETASSLTSTFVRFDPKKTARETVAADLTTLLQNSDADAPTRTHTLWTLPAVLGGEMGPDLQSAADAAKTDVDQAVTDILAARLRVLALGFAPGQPYLGFLGPKWDIPRRSEITPNVPRGALLLAVRQMIPFATTAPTGWRRVGWTPFRCYHPDRDTPLPLAAGDVIRFRQVDAQEARALEAASDGMGGATAEALS